MKINTLEDIKEMKLYTAKAESWYIFDTENYYIQLIVQGLDFEDADLDAFEDFSDEIIGMNNTEFLKWLVEKSEEEGYCLTDYLESEFFINPDNYEVEEMYDDKTKRKLNAEETSKLFANDGFQLSSSQPTVGDDEYFLTVKEANDYLTNECPFHSV